MTTPVSSTASTSAHFKRISPATLRARYGDGVPTAVIAAEFGIGRRALCRRAKKLGLSRGFKTKKPCITPKDEPLFASMWRAGIASGEIADHFKISARTVVNTCKRIGLPARGLGQRPKLTLAQFFEAQLGELMAHQARVEQLHMINAEMVDKIGYKWVGSEHVRELQAGGRP
jgi:hypothetical protein